MTRDHCDAVRAMANGLEVEVTTLADLAGSERIRALHLSEAMQWRRALPTA